jgi:hypothetical protein
LLLDESEIANALIEDWIELPIRFRASEGSSLRSRYSANLQKPLTSEWLNVR